MVAWTLAAVLGFVGSIIAKGAQITVDVLKFIFTTIWTIFQTTIQSLPGMMKPLFAILLLMLSMNIFLSYTVGMKYACDSSGILYEGNIIQGLRYRIDDSLSPSVSNVVKVSSDAVSETFGVDRPSGSIYMQNDGNFSEYFNIRHFSPWKGFYVGDPEYCDINNLPGFCRQYVNICKYKDDTTIGVKNGCYLLAQQTTYVTPEACWLGGMSAYSCSCDNNDTLSGGVGTCVTAGRGCRENDEYIGMLRFYARQDENDLMNPLLTVGFEFIGSSLNADDYVPTIESKCGDFSNLSYNDEQNGVYFDSGSLGGDSKIFFFNSKSMLWRDFYGSGIGAVLLPDSSDLNAKHDKLVNTYFDPVKESVVNADGVSVDSKIVDTAYFGGDIFSVTCREKSIDLGILGLYIFNTTAMLVMFFLVIILAIIGFLFK
jgi:hypothetical protein